MKTAPQPPDGPSPETATEAAKAKTRSLTREIDIERRHQLVAIAHKLLDAPGWVPQGRTIDALDLSECGYVISIMRVQLRTLSARFKLVKHELDSRLVGNLELFGSMYPTQPPPKRVQVKS